MPLQATPPAEVDIDADLVRDLLADQHPDLAGLALEPGPSGWDNALFRLGPSLVVRLPRRELAAPLVRNEQRWLPELAPRLPLPVPAPVRTGRPAGRYPWWWSVCPWLPGEPALHLPPLQGAAAMAAASALGTFLAALHVPAPDDAPANPFRGGPLAEKAEVVHERTGAMADLVDVDAVRACWADLVTTTPHRGRPRWVHGDLHPGNILLADGAVSAVIDFGDLTAGDPATDLAIAWSLLPAEARPVLREAAGVDDDTWVRGRAWALHLSLAYLLHAADAPAFEAMGRRTLAAALAGD